MLITVHEFGHFAVAKLCGVQVNEFSIGMGPAVWKRQGKSTLFSLRILPLGGYCALEGEDGGEEKPGAFGYQPMWRRAAVLAAGSAMNLILGLVISICLAAGAEALVSNTVALFQPAALSEESGLMAGDVITKIGGKDIHIGTDIGYALVDAGGKPVDVEVRRGGEKLLLEGVRFPSEEVSGMTVSRADFYLLREDKNPVTVLKHGVLKAGSFCGLVWDSIVKLVTGDVGLDQLSGPVGTTAAIGEAASQGFETLMMFTMFISINLGIFNLLPLPALDGGRLLLLAVEKLRGKKLSPKVEGAISFVGFSLLMLLMLYVTAGDIFRLMG